MFSAVKFALFLESAVPQLLSKYELLRVQEARSVWFEVLVTFVEEVTI